MLIISQNKTNDTLNNLSNIISKNPYNWSAISKRASLYFKSADYKNALQDYIKISNLKPYNSVVFYNIGQCYEKMHKCSKAINEYSKAISLDSNKSTYYYTRGRSYFHLENYNYAIRDFSKALDFHPDNITLINIRAECYEKTLNFNKAIKDYSKILKLDPTNADASFRLHSLTNQISTGELEIPSRIKTSDLLKTSKSTNIVSIRTSLCKSCLDRHDCAQTYIKDAKCEYYKAGPTTQPNHWPFFNYGWK